MSNLNELKKKLKERKKCSAKDDTCAKQIIMQLRERERGRC